MSHSSSTNGHPDHTKNQKNSRTVGLMKPLTLAVSAYFLAACSSTGTTTPTGTIARTTPTPAAQSQSSGYSGVLDEAMLDELEDLLQATDMSMVQGDASTVHRHGNVWDSVRRGYKMGDTYNARIEAQKSWFYSRQSYLDRLTARASRYLHHTVTEAERRGIPTELALLPIIESSYDPSATSNAAAAGLWQFIPSTGRIYGLNQSSSYDGRRDVIESTRAAYDFLTSLYNQFGSWELALAAYNAGPGRVSRAIRANEAAGLPTDYWSLNLPTETMNYVPRFIAVSQIVASPSSYGVNLPAIANHSHFRTVPVNYGVSLQEIANITGVPFDELRLLNPALTNFTVDSAGPNRIVIPDSLNSSVDDQLSALTGFGYGGSYSATAPAQTTQYVLPNKGAAANSTSQQELMQSNTLPTTIAQVTANNTIVQEPPLTQEERDFIAAQIQATTPEAVQAVNPNDGNIQLDALQTAQSVLEARGQSKSLSYSAPATTVAVAPQPQPVVSEPEPVIEPSYTPPPATAPQQPRPQTNANTSRPAERKPAARPESYTVRSGDTLTGIAAANNLTVSQLASYNNISTNTYVQRGQKLWLVPGKVKPAPKPTQTATDTAAKTNNAANNTKTATHRVQAGESLTSIARKHDISVHQLAELNSLSPTDGLLIGQQIKVPAAKVTNAAPAANTATKPASQRASSQTGTYTVKPGDTLTGIANSLGVSNADIAALNNFQPNAGMIAGQVIKVPVSKETVARKLNNQPIKYTVKSGDSLTSVAARHGITIKELADANNLNTNSNLLLGTTITIPAAGSDKPAAIATPARSQSANTQATPSQAVPTGNTIANTENYTVQSGEHLTGLATRFGVSVNDLAKTNNLATNAQLRRGQVIKVPKLTTTYKVKSGDNLISLARRYGISTEELAKMNNLENNASLRIGQTLTVPNK